MNNFVLVIIFCNAKYKINEFYSLVNSKIFERGFEMKSFNKSIGCVHYEHEVKCYCNTDLCNNQPREPMKTVSNCYVCSNEEECNNKKYGHCQTVSVDALKKCTWLVQRNGLLRAMTYS